MFKTFRSKINFSYFILFFLVFVSMIISIQIFLKDALIRDLKSKMIDDIMIVKEIKDNVKDKNELKKRLKKISTILKIKIAIVDITGKVLFQSQGDKIQSSGFLNLKEIKASGANNYGERIIETKSGDTRYFIALKPNSYFIRVEKSLNNITSVVNDASQFVYIISGIFLVVFLIINYILANFLSFPVRDIVNFTKRFKQGDYNVRLPVYKLDELGLVKLSLNYLAKNVSKNIESISMQKMRLEAVVKSVSEGILLLDQDQKIFLNNKGFFDVLGASEKNIKGKYFYEAINNSDIIDFIDESMKKNKKRKEHFNITIKGTFNIKTVNVTSIPIEDQKGCIILLEDITEEFNLQRLKREFVSNASHEFKTPLAIMKGYIETLLSGVENQNRKKDFLEKINHNIKRLDNIINDVITLNKIEDYNDLFAFTNTNLQELLNNTLQLLKPAANNMDIEIHKNISSNLRVNTSPELLEIVLYNIIDNAIKYNNPGGYVKVETFENENYVVIVIADSGIGIPDEHREKVFERFFTVNKSRSRDIAGTGLGLSIVKHAIIILKGHITVSNNPEGKGSVFKLKLPVSE